MELNFRNVLQLRFLIKCAHLHPRLLWQNKFLKVYFLHCILSFMVAPSLSFFSTHVNQFVLYLTDPHHLYLFQDFYRRMQNQDCRVTASK